MKHDFIIKDSGKRAKFKSGMVRDIATDKLDYSLALDGPMFKRWVVHLTKGAVKYAKRNWMKANGLEEYNRFKEAAIRHFMQDLEGDRTEDHKAAVYFNLNGMAYLEEKMKKPKRRESKKWRKQ